MKAGAMFSGALVLVVLAFGAGVASAKSIALDASWWGTITAEERLGAVEGSTDAYAAGWDRGFNEGSAGGKRSREPRFSHTFGYYLSAISDFYDMHERARKVGIGPIMGCLADSPLVSCSELAGEITSGE